MDAISTLWNLTASFKSFTGVTYHKQRKTAEFKFRAIKQKPKHRSEGFSDAEWAVAEELCS
jgi:hypothetical protein